MKLDRGLTAATLAPFFIAFSIIIIKMAGTLAPPLVVAGLGPLLSLPFLLLLQLTSREPLNLKQLLTEPARKPFLRVLLSRSLVGQILIVTGFTLTTGVKSVLLLRLEPLFVVLWAVLLRGEKPSARKLLLLLLLVIGSAFVVSPGAPSSALNLGDALVVLSLLFFSYSYLPTQEVVSQANPAALNILANLFGGCAISLIALFIYGAKGFNIPPNALSLIAGYSFVFFACGCSLYFYAFKTLKPWVIASFLSLEVVFGLALAFVMLNERMTLLQGAGAATVVLAMIGIAKYSQAEIGSIPESGLLVFNRYDV